MQAAHAEVEAYGRKAKCFGRNAALTVESTPLLLQGAVSGSTVNLELARRSGDGYDWKSKLVIQLSEDELAALACVLLGFLPRYHFKRPGKGIEIERQPEKLFVRGTAGAGNIYTLPLPPGRVFAVSTLVIGRLQEHFETRDTQVVLASLRGAAALLRN
ncbi:hypothetical protein DOK_12021 [gamma proteobacterium BDW918]|nr:hypothetical protein DOK_12021 [gamma proteobacterium BDW918]